MKLTREWLELENSTQQLDAACMGFTALQAVLMLVLTVWQPVPVLPFCPWESQLIQGKLQLHKRRNRFLPVGKHVASVTAFNTKKPRQGPGDKAKLWTFNLQLVFMLVQPNTVASKQGQLMLQNELLVYLQL